MNQSIRHIKRYTEISHNIRVDVRPMYLEQASSPIKQKHVFAYFITIHNGSDKPVKLLKRHWKIEDSDESIYEVDGDGVIGKRPEIAPGSSFEYNSSCRLRSFKGSMKGYYVMEKPDGEMVKVLIPEFQLTSPLLN